ncbi:DUF960 family protein [Mammaliicoccus sp. C-M11]|uniref:DUF960 family protein n=1 Tax=Mammaliicoccus sp. C-M11 TaxID=2898671 RepID=UPI001EFC04D8|nr:DUF960 family protein [Mammaliicoccus sp. C-M11]
MDKYITRGISDGLPLNIQITLWKMIEMKENDTDNKIPKDYFNIFNLDQKGHTLYVKHKQERPAYEKTWIIPNDISNIPSKVYVIREDDIDCFYFVMLLPNEY